MIITDPEVIEYIKEFEKVENSLQTKSKKLSNEDQIILYTITRMFEYDSTFKAVFSFLIAEYSRGVTELPEKEFSNLWKSIIKLVLGGKYSQKQESKNDS